MSIHKLLSVGLIILQLFVGLSAIPPGILMILQPDGTKVGIPLKIIENAPFGDFLIPGIFLVFLLGLGHILGAIANIQRFKLTGTISLILGLITIGWISIQVYFIGLQHGLQFLYFLIGIFEIILAIILIKYKAAMH